MKNNLLQIDVSNSKYKTNEDLIKINIRNDEILQVNYSKLVSQSKYIRDKYNYSEAVTSIQAEIEHVKHEMKIDEISIKYFLQLLQEEKVNLPLDKYKDIYTLSEHFCVQKLIEAFDEINREKLFKDLDFSIQFLHNYSETKLITKLENFLSERINNSIENKKFKELPISTICRIFELSKKETINQDLIVDFIFESAKTRFILLQFVELDKLSDMKLNELIKLFEKEDIETRKKYLEFLPFSLSLIKNMKSKYDQLFRENGKLKEENENIKDENKQLKEENDNIKDENKQLKEENENIKDENKQLKEENENIKNENKQLKEENDNIKDENKQLKEENENIKDESGQLKEENENIKGENKQLKEENENIKDENKQLKNENERTKNELKQAKDEHNSTKIESKQHIQSIVVGGYNQSNQLGENPNNKNKSGNLIISPPLNLPVDYSSILSFSVYCHHSVLVTNDGSLMGVGHNKDGRISASFGEESVSHFTGFCIKDRSGGQLVPVSAVCTFNGTLYMFRKSDSNMRQLVLCDCQIDNGTPVFLNIGNCQPVSLFGGYNHLATIGVEGEVIFINGHSFKNSPSSLIEAISLPGCEKASSVACCNDSVVVLSSNGRVFESPVKNEEGSVLKFSAVSELTDKEIVCVSGTSNHCLAVSKEGRVFGRGSNEHGQLGLGKGIDSSSTFKEILSLRGHKIYAAYAGHFHSLFKTREGKIFASGANYNGELLLSCFLGDDVYLPTQMTIIDSASFCIAGNCLSVVFTGNSPPPNMPNMRIKEYK